MASLDDAESSYKENKKGIIVRPDPDEKIFLALRVPADASQAVYIRQQWWDNDKKSFHDWNEEVDRAAGRRPMQSFCLNATVIEYDPKDESRTKILALKKSIVALDGDDFVVAKKENKERTSNGKSGFERCLFVYSCEKVKGGKKVYDLRFHDYLSDDLVKKISDIPLFSFAEIETEVNRRAKKDDAEDAAKADTSSYKAGAASDSAVKEDDAMALLNAINKSAAANAIAAEFKVRFGVGKLKELKVSQLSEAQAWVKAMTEPQAASGGTDL